MKMTVLPVVIGTLGTIFKGFLKKLEDLEIRGRTETIQTMAFLGLARILISVLEIWKDLLSHRLQWKTIG